MKLTKRMLSGFLALIMVAPSLHSPKTHLNQLHRL